MSITDLSPWTVEAVNLPEHEDNPIHTDSGAIAAGFPGALVAGVTTYVYLTHPAGEAWGVDWARAGGAEVRFHAPVLDHDVLQCEPVQTEDGQVVEARVGGEVRATCRVWAGADEGPVELRDGASLEPLRVTLDHGQLTYSTRAGDDLKMYGQGGVIHPVAWLSLANRICKQNLVRGAWIHTMSRVQHHRVAQVGSEAVLTGSVVERFHSRIGERVVLDLRVWVDGDLTASVEHQAIISMAN